MSEEVAPEPGLSALRVIRHDFKTPLTSLKMLAQLFKLGVERGTLASDNERTARNVRMLSDQVDKLAELADALFDLSLIQAGGLRLEKQRADLRPVIELAAQHAGANVHDLQLTPQPIWGDWDTALLGKALRWLLSTRNHVDIRVTEKDREVTIEIKESPAEPGQAPVKSPYLFIAASIIARHGGRIDDGGVITLPTAEPVAIPAA
jgi:signal transduction histidine kinase